MDAIGATPFSRNERLEAALYLKGNEASITDLVHHRCDKLLELLDRMESAQVIRELLYSALKSLAEGDIGYYLLTLMRLLTRSIHLKLRFDDVNILGANVLIALNEYIAANPSPANAMEILEEVYLKFTSDEVRVKLFQDYVHIQEIVQFRHVEELQLLGQVSQFSEVDLTRDARTPEELLAKLMSILQADGGVAFFHSQFFRVIYSKFSGNSSYWRDPKEILSVLSGSMRKTVDPQVLATFARLAEEGFYWRVEHSDRQINEMLEEYFPKFHSNPPLSRVQRILDFDMDNPLLKVCTAHSYMTYDLYVDEENYGMIFISRVNPPDFTEEDYRFLSTFGGTLRQIVGNVILESRLKEMATTDAVTGVNNRRQFETFLENELARATRYNHSLGMAMIDLDNFKDINDTYGHQAGDYILAELCRALKRGLRATEIISRYGGEEFAVIVPQADYEVTELVGEKIRSIVENHRFVYNGLMIPLTVSVGVALFPQMAIDRDSLVEMADKALYRAKRAGKNRVCYPAKYDKDWVPGRE
jgi:diguanylate cyclase (GGDEF)-like protein